MRPGNTEEERKAVRKRAAVRGVVFFGVIQLALAALFGSLCFIPELPLWGVILFGILAALCLALIPPAILVLKERVREIEGGEEDAAAQY